MPFRRLLVVTAVDGDPSQATFFLERFLPLVSARRRLRPVLFLGRDGTWSDRLTGFGPVLNGDALDDWWGPRFVESLGWRRDHRQLRAFRARWWRLRLRRARLLAVSGPLPPTIACALPRGLRALAEHPRVPTVALPSPRVDRPTVVGLGTYDSDDGVDLWLRTVHEMKAALATEGRTGRFVWFRTPETLEREDGVEHERWHLGLGDDVEMPLVTDWWALAHTIVDCSVLLLAARPGADGLGELDERVPGDDWVHTGLLPVVGFAGAAPDDVQVPGVVKVTYPDVKALAGAAVRAADGDEALDRVLAGAARR